MGEALEALAAEVHSFEKVDVEPCCAASKKLARDVKTVEGLRKKADPNTLTEENRVKLEATDLAGRILSLSQKYAALSARMSAEWVSISKRYVSDAETDKKRLPIVQAICSQAWWTYVQLSRPDALQEHSSVQLSPREREALIWVKAGKSNEQIAEIMLVTERTVQFHINNAMMKLGASNRISAVVIGLQRGLIRL